ncbi:MAG: helix-turn-helix domain-containing protein [Enterocloster sp.]|uniref:helix-turn-helix domain-containing protein n=1 Tax=Enterocloster sp. TaxID=2719315 RepID=UPI00399B2244
MSQNHTARSWRSGSRCAETSLKNYFRGVFGENLSTFLREVRMRRAAELLQSSELRVAEIAAQVGYENQSKFAAVFVRHFGCPPLEYRRGAHLSIADDN